jgi:hypothetical protein
VRRSIRCPAAALLGFAVAFLPAPHVVAQGAPGFDRSGPYLLAGGGYSFQNFDGVGTLNVDDSPNFVFDAGWRFHPNFALELGFEWNPGFEASVAGIQAEGETYTATAGMKICVLRGRIQPFLLPNVGVLVANLDAGALGDTITTPALRAGGGIDVYVTRSLFVSLMTAYVLPLDKDLNDFQYIPLSGALGWRF